MRRSDDPNVDCLRALVAGLRLVLHARALGERAVAIGLDAGVVDEEVLAAFLGRDEAEALLAAEPLDGTLSHVFLSGVFVLRLPWCLLSNRLRAPALLAPDSS